jgi:hypothetical protein
MQRRISHSHSIKKRSFTLETVNSLLADLIEEVVEGNAEE